MNAPLDQALAAARVVASGAPRCYVFHVPGASRAWVGWGAGRVVTLRGGEVAWEEAGRTESEPAGPHPYRQAAAQLDRDRPVFFLTSLDLARRRPDPDLPLLHFYQPDVEVAFDATAAQSAWLGGTPRDRDRVEQALAAPDGARVPRPALGGAYDLQGWDNEGDARFLARLRDAVATLQGRDGKMILMRPFARGAAEPVDLLRLFAIYAGFEDRCAAAHFARLRPGVESVGCSPENVFELDGDRLVFDVVAGTRGVSDDPEKDRRWARELLVDPKEIREHEMALARYRARLETLCRPDSIVMDLHRSERRLFHVRHLYSRLAGTLRDRASWVELAEQSDPPLESYPRELIPLADPLPEPTRFYGGMVGRAAPRGAAAACFLNLRSVLAKGGRLHTAGGVGVIGESAPELELLEVHNKLRALAAALRLWDEERTDAIRGSRGGAPGDAS